MNQQQMNDGRYNMYPWLRRTTTVKFFGGPLHGQFMEVEDGQNELLVTTTSHYEDYYSMSKMRDPAECIPVETGRYRRFEESYVVFPWGVQPLFGFAYYGTE